MFPALVLWPACGILKRNLNENLLVSLVLPCKHADRTIMGNISALTPCFLFKLTRACNSFLVKWFGAAYYLYTHSFLVNKCK